MLSLRSLNHLVVLARRLNYVRAADELGITQPALTRSIQALERRLQAKLFDRDRGKVSLTPHGRTIAEQAGFLLADAEELEQCSRLYGAGESGSIRYGVAPMPARALLLHALSQSLTRTPAVTNEVVVRDVEALWGMLVAGEIEFFVSPNPPLHDLSQARVEVLGAFPLSLIVRAGHPLLEGTDGAARYPLVRSSWTGIAVPEEIVPHIRGVPNVIEDFETLARLTSCTDCVWLSSAFAVQDEIARGTLVELWRAPQAIDVVSYSLQRRAPSPLAVVTLQALRTRVGELIVDVAKRAATWRLASAADV